MLGVVIAEIQQINPLQSLNATNSSNSSLTSQKTLKKQKKKRDLNIKDARKFENIGERRLRQTLAESNPQGLRMADIYQDDLDSIDFLEGLPLPNMRYLKLTSRSTTNNTSNITTSNTTNITTSNRRTKNIKPRINIDISIDQLEIDTTRIFDGIHTVVERTIKKLLIPLPIFAQMNTIEPVRIIATGLKFTQVSQADLRDYRIKGQNGQLMQNRSVKIIEFVTGMKLGSIKSETATAIVNKLIPWTNQMFAAVRCIKIEEKDFDEYRATKRLFLDEPAFPNSPSLSMILVNELAIFVKYNRDNTTKYCLNEPEFYTNSKVNDVINITALNNIKCKKFITFREAREYIINNPMDFDDPKRYKLSDWIELSMNNLIETELSLKVF